MPLDVINRVNKIRRYQGMASTITYANRKGDEIIDTLHDYDDETDIDNITHGSILSGEDKSLQFDDQEDNDHDSVTMSSSDSDSYSSPDSNSNGEGNEHYGGNHQQLDCTLVSNDNAAEDHADSQSMNSQTDESSRNNKTIMSFQQSRSPKH
eukprot:902936-Ditylum_brightwellii.AAC.1